MIFKKQENKNQNIFFAASVSIAIHFAAGLFLILGLSNNVYNTPGLNTANSILVSLESINGSNAIPPAEKKANRKQSMNVATWTTTIQKDTKNTLATVSAAKNISAQSSPVKEDGGGQSAAAGSSINFSDSTTLPEAGYSSGFVSANPLYRENAPPVYPAIAKLRGYEGVVLVNAEILPDGRVGNTAISKSSGYTILDQSAIEAVKLWKFEPAKKAGKPFAIRVKLPIKFVLHDDNSQS
jgi:TonB family protein